MASRGSAVFCLRAGHLFPWQGFYHRTRSLISMRFRLFPSSSRRSSVCRFVFPEQQRCLSTAQRCPWGLALEDAFRVACRCGFVRGHGTSVRSACPRPQRALASVTSVCVIGLWADLSCCAWSVFLPHCCPACPSLRLRVCSLPRHNCASCARARPPGALSQRIFPHGECVPEPPSLWWQLMEPLSRTGRPGVLRKVFTHAAALRTGVEVLRKVFTCSLVFSFS